MLAVKCICAMTNENMQAWIRQCVYFVVSLLLSLSKQALHLIMYANNIRIASMWMVPLCIRMILNPLTPPLGIYASLTMCSLIIHIHSHTLTVWYMETLAKTIHFNVEVHILSFVL